MLEEFVPFGEQSPNEIARELPEIGDDEAVSATVKSGLESLPRVVQPMVRHARLQTARQLRTDVERQPFLPLVDLRLADMLI